MRILIKAAAVVAAVTLFIITLVNRPFSTSAQGQPSAPPASRPADQFPTSVNLSCQGCHGPGKTLPNLAGETFHKDAHSAIQASIHQRPGPNGGPIATCQDCHTRNGDMTTMLPASDPRSTVNRAVIAETCGRCHGDRSTMQGSGISDRPFLSYRESVHAKAIARGNTAAAICSDCHNSHDIRPASDPQSSIAKINIPTTCGKCHENEASEFNESVHGQAVTRGVSRSPACTDCHGIHDIQQPFDQNTGTASAAIATDTCSKCHEGVVLTQEYGVASGRVSSYKDSYHGLASQMGSKVAANCASCHGVHNILPSSDPRSMINGNNLAQTCGQCHMGAGSNFTRGRVHMTSTLAEDGTGHDAGILGTTIVRWIYIPLIVLVIGGMVVHNALVWRKKAAAKRREARTIVRLSANQRFQHWVLLSSFILLVFSGFALAYPDSWAAWALGGNEQLRRIVHRIAAVLMLLMGAYHLLYLALTREGRLWLRDMWPKWKDVRDLVANVGYYAGTGTRKPKIARFGYAEKAEYWAVVWGTIIMGLTGLMIWFKIEVFGFLPRWWIDIALAVHLYEAILATLAIIVWHFYQVIFDPDVYPLNFAFLDGRVSEEAFKEEHELAYEELKTASGHESDNDENPDAGELAPEAR